MKQDKSRVPALLAALLTFTAMLLALRSWTLANENAELAAQASAIAEALQISAAAQDTCALDKATAQRAEKRLGDELAKMRNQWEKLRGQLAQTKPRLEEAELCAAARTTCSEQLISAQHSDEAKDDAIASLRVETERLRSETLGLIACKAQLKLVHSKQSRVSAEEYADEGELVHRDALQRGAKQPSSKRKKGSRPKKTRPLQEMDEESIGEGKEKVADDMPAEGFSDDEDDDVAREEVVEEPIERVAVRRFKSTTTTTTTELPEAADELQEEVVSKSSTAAPVRVGQI